MQLLLSKRNIIFGQFLLDPMNIILDLFLIDFYVRFISNGWKRPFIFFHPWKNGQLFLTFIQSQFILTFFLFSSDWFELLFPQLKFILNHFFLKRLGKTRQIRVSLLLFLGPFKRSLFRFFLFFFLILFEVANHLLKYLLFGKIINFDLILSFPHFVLNFLLLVQLIKFFLPVLEPKIVVPTHFGGIQLFNRFLTTAVRPVIGSHSDIIFLLLLFRLHFFLFLDWHDWAINRLQRNIELRIVVFL